MDADSSSNPGEKPAYAKRDEAALENKGALKSCEACGGDFVPMGLRGFIQSVEDDGTMRRGIGSSYAIAICRNCGLVRLHSTDLLYLDEDN
jgi:hypothetical protein